MDEALKETGKNLMTFANILTVVGFFQPIFKNGYDENLFIYGIFSWIILYILGNLFIILGKDLENLDKS